MNTPMITTTCVYTSMLLKQLHQDVLCLLVSMVVVTTSNRRCAGVVR